MKNEKEIKKHMLLKEIKEFIESPTRFINFFPLTNAQNFFLV